MSNFLDETTLSPVAELFGEFALSGLPANNHSNGLEAARLVFTGQGYLVSFTVNSTNTGAQFIQLHDASAIPTTGAVPAVVFDVSATSDKMVSYSLPGRYFLRGLVICNSSTAATLTAGSADCFFDVQYIPVAV